MKRATFITILLIGMASCDSGILESSDTFNNSIGSTTPDQVYEDCETFGAPVVFDDFAYTVRGNQAYKYNDGDTNTQEGKIFGINTWMTCNNDIVSFPKSRMWYRYNRADLPVGNCENDDDCRNLMDFEGGFGTQWARFRITSEERVSSSQHKPMIRSGFNSTSGTWVARLSVSRLPSNVEMTTAFWTQGYNDFDTQKNNELDFEFNNTFHGNDGLNRPSVAVHRNDIRILGGASSMNCSYYTTLPHVPRVFSEDCLGLAGARWFLGEVAPPQAVGQPNPRDKEFWTIAMQHDGLGTYRFAALNDNYYGAVPGVLWAGGSIDSSPSEFGRMFELSDFYRYNAVIEPVLPIVVPMNALFGHVMWNIVGEVDLVGGIPEMEIEWFYWSPSPLYYDMGGEMLIRSVETHVSSLRSNPLVQTAGYRVNTAGVNLLYNRGPTQPGGM